MIPKRYFSRSSYEAFSLCQRKGYYQFMKDGTGYEAPKGSALLIGLGTHKGIEVAVKGGSPEEVECAVREELSANSPSSLTAHDEELAVGLALAWQRVRLPYWRENFDFVSIEEEIETPLAEDLVLQARADLVAREKASGLLFVVNWKTTSSLKDWTLKWLYDMQAMTETLSVQEKLGENVVGCVFEGLYKGSKLRDGKWGSPLVTAYTDGVVWAPHGERDRPAGAFERVHPHESFPGGTAAWVEFLDPERHLADIFGASEPILKNDERVRRWLDQVVARERTNREMLFEEVPEEDRETYFWQNPSRENCRWCDFKPACWEGLPLNEIVGLSPRVDHHGPSKAE